MISHNDNNNDCADRPRCYCFASSAAASSAAAAAAAAAAAQTVDGRADI